MSGGRPAIPDPTITPAMKVWPDTGRALGLCRAATYKAVASGEIPSIRIGGRLLVPTAALRRLLSMDPELTIDWAAVEEAERKLTLLAKSAAGRRRCSQ